MKKVCIFFGLFLLVACGPSNIPAGGLIKEGGEDGSPSISYEVNSQIPYSGPAEIYYGNQRLKEKGNYKDGKKEGLWEGYFENGQLEYKENRRDGKREGILEYYHENGKLGQKGNYKDGKPEGPYEWFHDNGKLGQKGNYKDGNLDGLVEFFGYYGGSPIYTYHKNGEKLELLELRSEDVVMRNRIIYKINETSPVKGFVKIKSYI